MLGTGEEVISLRLHCTVHSSGYTSGTAKRAMHPTCEIQEIKMIHKTD